MTTRNKLFARMRFSFVSSSLRLAYKKWFYSYTNMNRGDTYLMEYSQ